MLCWWWFKIQTHSLYCRFGSSSRKNDPTKHTIEHKEAKHDPRIHPPSVLVESSTLQHIQSCQQTLGMILILPRKTLTSLTPIFIYEKRIQWVPIKGHIVHKEPIFWDAIFWNEVAREEEVGSKNCADERISRNEIWWDCT